MTSIKQPPSLRPETLSPSLALRQRPANKEKAQKATTSTDTKIRDKSKARAIEQPETSEKSSDEASENSGDKEQAVAGDEEDEEQDILEALSEDLVRELKGREKPGVADSAMITPDVTPHATPRRSTRFKMFNKDYLTGKPKER